MSENRVVLDTKEWDQFFAGVTGKLKDVAGLLMSAASLFAFKDIIEHFSREEGPDGAWPKRSSATQQAYAKIAAGIWQPPKGMRAGSFNPSNKLLQLTGNLRQSINPTNMSRRGQDSINIFANAPYAGRHDEGGGGIPARPFMWLSDEVQDKMLDAILTMAMEGA